MAQVVVDVEMLVVGPHRAAQIERHEADDLPIPRDERELAPDHVHDIGVGRRWPFEDPDGGDVHVAHVVFDMEE